MRLGSACSSCIFGALRRWRVMTASDAGLEGEKHAEYVHEAVRLVAVVGFRVGGLEGARVVLEVGALAHLVVGKIMWSLVSRRPIMLALMRLT